MSLIRFHHFTGVIDHLIDLALSDGQGQTTARRVLSPAELGHTADSLPAGGEVSPKEGQ